MRKSRRARSLPLPLVVLAAMLALLVSSLAFAETLTGSQTTTTRKPPTDGTALSADPDTAAQSPILGVVGVDGSHLTQEKAAGVGAVTIGMGWNSAQPSQDSFSTAYLSSMKQEIAAADSHGLKVVLDPGLQYAPAWVFSLPGGTRFVDQYGDAFTGSPGSGNDVANAITDGAVRSAERRYLEWLGSKFAPGQIFAVRMGGGPLGELRYPDADYMGHSNCYWAYDASSQLTSPVPGWVPGTGTPAQATAFLNSYNKNLNRYGRWLNRQMWKDFATTELVMLPGWGERPGGAALETASLLTQDMPEFNQGLDWTDLLASLPEAVHSVAYTTYLDAPTVLLTPQLEDPIDFIASLVTGTPIRLGGENTGNGTLADLTLCFQRARQLNLFIVQWMDESQLIASDSGQDPASPTLAMLGSVWKASASESSTASG
jgi:hypothetical protein